jgi:hypothetical protein
MICAICDRDPCLTPSFCAACRDADRRKARGEPPRCAPLRPAHYRETLKGRAAASTVEALMFELRGGTNVLRESAAKRRLSELSEQQLHEVCGRLQKPVITRAWTPDEIATLVDKWNGCHG